jgi:lipoyl(octanoyl) transferase
LISRLNENWPPSAPNSCAVWRLGVVEYGAAYRLQKKIASIGLSIRVWVTMHGFALNVCTRLEDFSLIHACGLRDRKPASMQELLGFQPSMDQVSERLRSRFSELFDPKP